MRVIQRHLSHGVYILPSSYLYTIGQVLSDRAEGGMTAKDSSLFAWSFGMLGLRPSKVMRKLTREALSTIDEASTQDISNLAWGLARAGSSGRELKFVGEGLCNSWQVGGPGLLASGLRAKHGSMSFGGRAGQDIASSRFLWGTRLGAASINGSAIHAMLGLLSSVITHGGEQTVTFSPRYMRISRIPSTSAFQPSSAPRSPPNLESVRVGMNMSHGIVSYRSLNTVGALHPKHYCICTVSMPLSQIPRSLRRESNGYPWKMTAGLRRWNWAARSPLCMVTMSLLPRATHRGVRGVRIPMEARKQ